MKGGGLTYGSICNENDEIINEGNLLNLNRIYSKQESIQSNDSSLFDHHRFQQLEQEQKQQLETNNYEDSLKNDNNDEMDEYEQEMAKQYLSKYGDIRRHTIGTNPARSHRNYQNNNNNNNNNNQIMLTSEQQVFASNHINSLLSSTAYESSLIQIKEINNNLENSIDFNQNILIDPNSTPANNFLFVQSLSNNNDPSNEPYNERYSVNNFQSQFLIPSHSGKTFIINKNFNFSQIF
jgi:hypothetical protein